MTIRIAGAACALFLACASMVQAASPQIVVRYDGSRNLDAVVADAAEKVCAKALASDPFGDYGSMEECVSATIDRTIEDIDRNPQDPRAHNVVYVK